MHACCCVCVVVAYASVCFCPCGWVDLRGKAGHAVLSGCLRLLQALTASTVIVPAMALDDGRSSQRKEEADNWRQENSDEEKAKSNPKHAETVQIEILPRPNAYEGEDTTATGTVSRTLRSPPHGPQFETFPLDPCGQASPPNTFVKNTAFTHPRDAWHCRC